MAGLCNWVIRIVGVLYLVALALLLIGTFGLFGQEQDPLSGIFLLPLGLPWLLWSDGVPDVLLPSLAAFVPLLNILILTLLCRYFRSDEAQKTKPDKGGSDAL